MKQVSLLFSFLMLFIYSAKAQENTSSEDSLTVQKNLFVAPALPMKEQQVPHKPFLLLLAFLPGAT